MDTPVLTDEELLASHELGSFAVFYRAHVDGLLGFSAAAPTTQSWLPI
jgi:hypothetical protein